MSPLRLALLSLARRRFPTLIAVLAIALPVAAGGVLLRLYHLSANRFATLDHGFDAVVGAKAGQLDLLLGALNGEGDTPEPITLNLYETIRDKAVAGAASQPSQQQAFLRSLIPITVFGRYQGHRLVGSDRSFWQRPAAEPGPVFVAGSWPTTSGEVAVSQGLAKELHLQVGDALTADPWVSRSPDINAVLPKIPLKVVGITKTTGLFWDQVLVGDLSDAQQVLAGLPPSELNPAWKDRVTHYLLANCLRSGCHELKDLINNATVAQMVSVPEQLDHLQNLLGDGHRMGLTITTMILLLGGLAVAGIMVTRFDAMLGQLAVLRAIGYGLREVTLWLVIEGLLLGLTAVCFGALLDGVSFPWFRDLTQAAARTDQGASMSLLSSTPIWLAAVAATIAAACLPLIRLSRQDVHRTLRS